MFKKRHLNSAARIGVGLSKRGKFEDSDNDSGDNEEKPTSNVKSNGSKNDVSSSDDETVVVRKGTKSANFNPLKQSSKRLSSSRCKQDSSDGSGDDEREKTAPPKTLVNFSYKSSRSGVVTGSEGDQGATSTIQIDTEHDRDFRAVSERTFEAQQSGDASSSLYTGKDNYTMYNKPKEKVTGVKAALKGPVRAPDFLRATTRWDYAPDICKDYKETGFCGFGDSCKFLHDRSDYKFGWQLENEYIEQHKGGPSSRPDTSDDVTQYEIDSDEEELPFKCLICRESFKNPVVTKCKHYFCEKCALAQCRKSMRCYVCGLDTKGMFNPAKEIVSRMNKGKATLAKEDETSDEGD